MSSKLSVVAVAIIVAWSGAARAQPGVAQPDPDRESEAEAEYDRRFIVFEDEYSTLVTVHRHGNMATGSVRQERHSVALRGVQRERLEGLDFYLAIGRPDLASAYRRGERKRAVVGGAALGGLVAAGTFAVLTFRALPGVEFDDCDVFSDDYRACRAAFEIAEERRTDEANARARTYAIAAGASFVGMVVLSAIYRNMDANPVSESERRIMAHDHNVRLRRDLDLTPRRGVSVQPYFFDGGGGLLAAGRF